MIRLFKQLLKSKVLSFTLLKYLVHFLNFLRVILAAKILGPFFFGIWGFLNLTVQYLSHSLLGVQYSVTLELSTSKDEDPERNRKIVSSALFIGTVIGMLLMACGAAIYFFDSSLFEQYEFRRYVIPLVVIVSLLNFQTLFFNIFRVYGSLYRIAFAELLVSCSLLITLFFAEGRELISYLLAAWIGSLTLSMFFFVTKSPISLGIMRYGREAFLLLRVGFPLLIYNLSYYLIIIASTTVLSQFYSVETMGHYTLATNISNAILLGINSIVWAFFPSILSKLKEGVPHDEVRETIYKINDLYLSSIFLIFIGFLLFSPILYWFLPRFAQSETALNLLFVAQVLLASNFAANSFTMARRDYLHLASLSFLSVVVVSVSALLFAFLKLDYYWIAFSSVLGAAAFSVLTRLNLRKQVPGVVAPVFNVTSIRVTLLIIVLGNLFFQPYLMNFNFAAILVYTFFNIGKLKSLYRTIKEKWIVS